MQEPTELRIIVNKQETPFEKGISSMIADNIENLIIKEDWIVLERLKAQREVYIAEVEKLKATDLEAVKNARFELIKEKIAEEVKEEFDKKLAEVELKVAHYDFVIAEEEQNVDIATEVINTEV